ncbi:hypothetical protein EDC04DRAFT_2604526 [Pisolithus marmoratus]|nr:hypothetical protein EDC04DRAFT_2604526 [Pisolithus marmoratus]
MSDWKQVYSEILSSHVGRYKEARGNSQLRNEMLAEVKAEILQHEPEDSVGFPAWFRVVIRREFLPHLDPEDQDDEIAIIQHVLAVTRKSWADSCEGEDAREEKACPIRLGTTKRPLQYLIKMAVFETAPGDGKKAFTESSGASKDWVLNGENTYVDRLSFDSPWQKLKVQQNFARAVFQAAYVWGIAKFTKKAKAKVPWGLLIKSPMEYLDFQSIPEGFMMKDPSKWTKADLQLLWDHWQTLEAEEKVIVSFISCKKEDVPLSRWFDRRPVAGSSKTEWIDPKDDSEEEVGEAGVHSRQMMKSGDVVNKALYMTPMLSCPALILKNLKGQKACNPLEVQQSLPLLHSTLVKEIMQISREELISIMQCCDIPVHSWVCILFGTLKCNIAYALCIEDSSISMLAIPQSLPYQSDPQSPSDGQSIFDVDLARGHGLEVTVPTSDEGHPISYCEGKEYYYGCSLSYFPMKWVKVLNVPAIFLSLHISLTTYISQELHNQLLGDPLICESCIQPGDFMHADPDNLRDKEKSRAQEPEVPGSDGNIDEGSDLIQVSVSMDKVLIIPPSTLQFSREKGYDITISDHVQAAHGPAIGIEGLIHSVDFISGCLIVLADDGLLHDVLISFCIKLENHSLHDIECQVGHEVWIISSPRKGYRGTLQSVGRTYCNVTIKSGIMWLKNTAVITESGMFLNGGHFGFYTNGGIHRTAPEVICLDCTSQHYSTHVTINCGSFSQTRSKHLGLKPLVQADANYGCVPWLFDNNFCDYANWHVCLRVAVSYNHGLLLKSAGQYCLILHGKLASQIHWVKKYQVKKDPKGVKLEDGTKLPFGDVHQAIPAN